MANHFSLLLIALTILNLSVFSSAGNPPFPSTLPPTTAPPPSPPSPSFQEETLNTIVDALMGQGGYGIWANLLSSSTTTTTSDILATTATLFIPSNTAISHLPTATSTAINFDPLLIPYHITPQRLSFSDLCLLKPFSRLPTLLQSKTILITNTSPLNFTIDDSPITHPNIYLSAAIAVHGIPHIFDYTLYGQNFQAEPEILDPTISPILPAAEILDPTLSNAAACFCPVFLALLCISLSLKISLRN